MSRWHVLALAALTAAAPQAQARQTGDVMAVRTVRFYRADSRQTLVKAFVQIPLVLFAGGGGSSAGAQGSYRVSVKVSDSTGLALLQDAWTNRFPAQAAQSGVYGLEMLEFAVVQGRYRVQVTVEDTATGRRGSAEADIVGFSEPPAASDLLLAPQMRLATEGDTVPQAGELRVGSTLVTGAAELRLTPLRSKAFYLIEAYSAEESEGTLAVAIRDQAGKSLLKTPQSVVRVPVGGGILRGQLDLTGLPEGTYTMVVSLEIGGQTVEREMSFSMAPLEQTLAAEAARTAQVRLTDEGFFAAMSEPQLDSAAAPLTYIAKSEDRLNLYKDLSVDAKRRYLTDFWTRRDATPGPARNEIREQFYAGIDHANRAFKEGGRANVPGWRTDRGRIFAKYGQHDEILQRIAVGRAPTYEVWKYTRKKGRYYIFADRTGFGGYQLLYSNDLTEVSKPDWREIITEDAVRDIGRWLGVDFYPISGVPETPAN
jgi:GWxTD domain-containing protein